jgi:inner membrane transporter RhtA
MSHSTRASGIALMTGSAAANQFGAATAALAFPVLGPVGVVAVRQWVAAAVLLTTVRPRITTFTREQWRAVLALALIFAAMNLTLYAAIERIGLGLAVTLEFLGPLSVALASSRRALDLGCAATAAAGVLVLARPQATADYAGILLGLAAAACWAGYIQVNRVVGARIPGAAGPAAAAGVSALLYVPVGAWILATHSLTAVALGRAAVAGVACSAIPMVCDLLALRRVPARFFGMFMSVHPVFAALIGLVILRQSLALPDWLAISVIVAANAVSVSGRDRHHGADTRTLPGDLHREDGSHDRCDGVEGVVRVQLREPGGGRGGRGDLLVGEAADFGDDGRDAGLRVGPGDREVAVGGEQRVAAERGGQHRHRQWDAKKLRAGIGIADSVHRPWQALYRRLGSFRRARGAVKTVVRHVRGAGSVNAMLAGWL